MLLRMSKSKERVYFISTFLMGSGGDITWSDGGLGGSNL